MTLGSRHQYSVYPCLYTVARRHAIFCSAKLPPFKAIKRHAALSKGRPALSWASAVFHPLLEQYAGSLCALIDNILIAEYFYIDNVL